MRKDWQRALFFVGWRLTEDMPTQVLLKVATFVGKLETSHRQLGTRQDKLHDLGK